MCGVGLGAGGLPDQLARLLSDRVSLGRSQQIDLLVNDKTPFS